MKARRKNVCLLAAVVAICFSIFFFSWKNEQKAPEILGAEIFDVEILLYYDGSFDQKSDFSQADYDRFVEVVAKYRKGRARINLLLHDLGSPFDLQWLCNQSNTPQIRKYFLFFIDHPLERDAFICRESDPWPAEITIITSGITAARGFEIFGRDVNLRPDPNAALNLFERLLKLDGLINLKNTKKV